MRSFYHDQSKLVGSSLVVRGNRGKAHWEVVKWILRHLKITLDVFLMYGANAPHMDLVGLIDLDHESDLEIRRSLVVGLV